MADTDLPGGFGEASPDCLAPSVMPSRTRSRSRCHHRAAEELSASSMNSRFRSAMCRACALSNRLRNIFAAVASWPPRSSVPITSR